MKLSVFLWGFGICASGFFFLAIWLRWLHDRVSEKASKQWIKDNFGDDIRDIKDKIKYISDNLIGTMNTKGIVTRLYEIEKHCIDGCPAKKEQQK